MKQKTFTEINLREPESPAAINRNKRIRRNKPIVYLFPIWYLRTHIIQAIVPIINIAGAFFNFVTFFNKNEHCANSRSMR